MLQSSYNLLGLQPRPIAKQQVRGCEWSYLVKPVVSSETSCLLWQHV